jgi:hypothetical protein
MISLFLKLKITDDHTNEIKRLNSKIEKTKASKLSIDELTKTQTEEQEIKTIFFSISDSFFFTEENDTDD